MTLTMIGILLLMSLFDGRELVQGSSRKQWIVYLAITVLSSAVLILYSVTFTKPNILAYLEVVLKPISRWFAV